MEDVNINDPLSPTRRILQKVTDGNTEEVVSKKMQVVNCMVANLQFELDKQLVQTSYHIKLISPGTFMGLHRRLVLTR